MANGRGHPPFPINRMHHRIGFVSWLLVLTVLLIFTPLFLTPVVAAGGGGTSISTTPSLNQPLKELLFIKHTAPSLKASVQAEGDPGVGDVAEVYRGSLNWGNTTEWSPGCLFEPIAVTVGPSGTIFVACYDNEIPIQEFDHSGKFLALFDVAEPLDGCTVAALASDSQGDIFVLDSGNAQVRKYSPKGDLLATWGGTGDGPGELSEPADMCIDQYNILSIADYGNNRVVRWDAKTGTPVGIWILPVRPGEERSRPSAIAVDESGDLFVTDQENTRIWKFNRRGSPLYGVSGGSQGPLPITDPVGLATGGGRLFIGENLVVDEETGTNMPRVCVLNTSNGAFISSWDLLPPGEGPYSAVTKLAIGDQGDLLVLDTMSGRLHAYSPGGTHLWAAGDAARRGTFIGCVGVTMGPDGDIYVADMGNHRIQVFTQKGAFIREIGWDENGSRFFQYPYFIAWGGGSWYVMDLGNMRISQFSPEWRLIRTIGEKGEEEGQFEDISGITVGPTGTLYAVDPILCRVQAFDREGAFLFSFGSKGKGPGELSMPLGILADPTGSLYVADFGNNRIQKFDSEGTNLLTFGSKGSGDGEFDGVTSLAVDDEGYILAVDSGNFRVQKFTPDGEFILKFGEGPGSEVGEFSLPYGIATGPLGSVFVSDYENNQITKFTRCRPGFNVDFTADISQGTAPLKVRFTDTTGAVGPVISSWIFGDQPGRVVTGHSVQHMFRSPGTWSVNHSISDGPTVSWKNVSAAITVKPLVSVDPGSLEVQVGAGRTAESSFCLSNQGTKVMTVRAGSSDEELLAVSPTLFTVKPGGSRDIKVTVRSGSNSAGDIRHAIVVVRANNVAAITVPVTIDIVGVPKIGIRPNPLREVVAAGTASTSDLLVLNRGTGNLTVTGVYTDQPWILVTGSEGFTVSPGKYRRLTVTWNAIGMEEGDDSSGTVTLFSNDPSYPAIKIPARIQVV